jgi:hypothetical protein
MVAPGAVVLRHRQLFAVMGFTVRGGRIVEIDALADPSAYATSACGGYWAPAWPPPGTGTTTHEALTQQRAVA